jgi:outer membrane phospholipase A
MRTLFATALGATLACLATPAAAQLRPMFDPPSSAAAAARDGVEVFLLNTGTTSQPAQGPAELEVTARNGEQLRMIAAPDGEGPVAPGAFMRVTYRLAAAAPPSQDITSGTLAPPAVVANVPRAERGGDTSAGESSGFFDRFHPYAPTYGVIGSGDAGTKLQFSFDFRLLGHDDGPHFDFAYTQTIFWALNRPSGPIRTSIYNPELFIDVPLGESTTVGGGYRHDSNGGGVFDSYDVNRVFVRAAKTFDLGKGWQAELTPMAWFYFGYRGNAPDIDRYWGYTSLGMSLGQQGGVKLAVTARGNPGTGKGSAEAFLSFPLARISDALPHLYLFGQAYTGYGEALIDYNKRATHVRAGIAFTR